MQEKPELIDTHAHLDFAEFSGDVGSVVERALGAGVGTIVTIGIDIGTSAQAVRIASEQNRVYATAGIHPHDSFKMGPNDTRELERIADHPKVVAIGEIGLDYFRNRQPHPVQIECMRDQLQIAVDKGKPAVFPCPGRLG